MTATDDFLKALPRLVKIETDSEFLKSLNLEPAEPEPLIEDLTFGTDIRGDEAFFIESFHINGWEVDSDVIEALRGKGPEFCRVLENGLQRHSHGWIEDGRIIQWG